MNGKQAATVFTVVVIVLALYDLALRHFTGAPEEEAVAPAHSGQPSR